MADKRVTVKVDVDAEDSKVKAIDAELQRLKMQRLQLKIDAQQSELQETEKRIESLKIFLDNVNTGNTNIHINDEDIVKAEQELESLESKKLNLQIAVADDELTQAKAEEEALNTTANVDIAVDDSAVQGAMQNINDGINQTKQGLSELAQGFNEVQQAGMQSEQNKAFLTMNLGADKAKQTYQDISDIVASMPGDDNTMRSVLSTAQALGNNLKPDEMEAATKTMADYMGGSATMGKQAIESQQDIMKYLLDGNTAELERGSIVSSQVDKLKDATTFMERQKAMQEVLNDLGYGGIANQDTMLNKQAEWEGMLYNSSDALSSMWLGAEKGMMDFVLGLNDATGGLAGMALVATTQFGPGLFSATQGIVTMIPGIQQLITGMGGLGNIIPTITGAISGAGSSLMALATGPVGIAVAAIALLAIGIYEAGKAFGWWTDVGSMLDAMKAGVMSLWEAFTSNPYVIQAIDLIRQGLTDAWNAIVGFGQAIMTALSGASGGQFDILSFMIQNLSMVLNTVGPIIIAAIQAIIQHFRNIYNAAVIIWPYISSAISTAMSIASGVINAGRGVFQGLQGVWNSLSGTVQSMASAISGALSAAGSAWNNFKNTVMNAVQPILDAASQVQDAVGNIGAAIGFGGIDTPVVSNGGYSGGSTTVTQGNTIIFNMYGDIRDEKTLDDTIDAINNRIQFESFSNGATENGSGGLL